MADLDIQPLVRIGPFVKLDTHTADVYMDPGSAIACKNADTHRVGKGLSNFFGRNAFIEFPQLDNINLVARYDVGEARPFWIVQDSAGTLYDYDLHNTLQDNITGSNGASTQMVQANGGVFCNSGQQIFVITDTQYPGTPQQRLAIAAWQYPAPSPSVYNYAVTVITGSNPNIPQGIYTYAFAQVINIPTANGDVQQTTAAVGLNQPYPFTTDIDDNQSQVQLTGQFSGTTPDGYGFKTAIYRKSNNVPVWYQVAIIDGSDYIDTATDQSIAGNAQPSFAGQVPPTSAAAPAPIAAYQDRMWVFAIVNDANTNNVPQTQVWYSNVGQPWNFDGVNQVLLLDDQQTPPIATTGSVALPYGNQPVAMVPLGSILMCFFNASTWFINGSSQTTYQPLELFPDIGMVGTRAWTLGGGMVAWVSAQGIWTYDGANLRYISDDIYNALQSISPINQTSCAAAYGDQTFFFSFPAADDGPVTYAYYLPNQTWTVLPYAATCFACDTSAGSNPSTTASWKFNQIIGVRPTTTWLDAWLDGKENDLGQGTFVTWKSHYFDGGTPHLQQDYQAITLSAPVQTGSVEVTLNFDYGYTPSAGPYTFDLSQGPTSRVIRIPQGSARAYAVQVGIQFTTPVGATQPITLWSITLGVGSPRAWVQPN